METFLDKIIADKEQELVVQKQQLPLARLKESDLFQRETISLKARLQAHSGSDREGKENIHIIAEFKRRSPSKGFINESAQVADITAGYEKAGATGISVLANSTFFGGSYQDVITARRNAPHTPILFKEFVVDEYQLYLAKASGADVVLLIAAALDPKNCILLTEKAKQLGLEILLELHTEDELSYLHPNIDMVGINNRNLKTFEVDTATSIQLGKSLPDDYARISESGISQIGTVKELRQAGFQGFLMGENFMKEAQPAEALKKFIQEANCLL